MSPDRRNPIAALSAFALLVTASQADAYSGFGLSPTNVSGEGSFLVSVNNYADELAEHWAVAVADGDVYGRELCDDDLNASCTGDSGTYDVDTGDSAYIATHGGGLGQFMVSSSSYNPGGVGNMTRPTYWELGESSIEYFETTACNSLDYADPTLLKSIVRGLHQWHGVHGEASIPYSHQHIADYIDDAMDGSASLAWITTLTVFDIWPETGEDMCAMSAISGSTIADCNARRANETYYNPQSYSDPPANETVIYHYYCNCDPRSAAPTPSC